MPDSSDRKSEADSFVASNFEGQGVLGHYVIVAEVLTPDGTELRIAASEGIAPWSATGMLRTASTMFDPEIYYPEEEDN